MIFINFINLLYTCFIKSSSASTSSMGVICNVYCASFLLIIWDEIVLILTIGFLIAKSRASSLSSYSDFLLIGNPNNFENKRNSLITYAENNNTIAIKSLKWIVCFK